MNPAIPAPMAAMRMNELVLSSDAGIVTAVTFLTASGRLGSPRVAACSGQRHKVRRGAGVSRGGGDQGSGVRAMGMCRGV